MSKTKNEMVAELQQKNPFGFRALKRLSAEEVKEIYEGYNSALHKDKIEVVSEGSEFLPKVMIDWKHGKNVFPEIREVSLEDNSFAGCNTSDCGLGADYELWVEGVRKDCRCEDCAVDKGWINLEVD